METRYIDTLCDVISEMLVARMSVLFTSRGLKKCCSDFAAFFLKCRLSNTSPPIDFSVLTNNETCHLLCFFYINVSK